ncbi:colipase-like isoform X2 [Eleutherodactylus coqui]|uniref:colipase-like isoform X2 n=1 Tax=Eleutherodactylus coqui TaxID=57060 RepID=UPI003463368D
MEINVITVRNVTAGVVVVWGSPPYVCKSIQNLGNVSVRSVSDPSLDYAAFLYLLGWGEVKSVPKRKNNGDYCYSSDDCNSGCCHRILYYGNFGQCGPKEENQECSGLATNIFDDYPIENGLI